MTDAEEAEFIALWTEGLSLKDIGARLGIPPGTVSSRAAALRRQGVALDKRPQGGAYPSQRAKARQEGPPAPAHAPAQAPARPPAPHPHPRAPPRAPAPLATSSSGPCACRRP
jgi:biotin operon repressor